MALPKEPRQKMINIMYLVLTALLALNVSSEILNAFKVVNKSLTTSNENIATANSTIYQSLEAKLNDPGTHEKAVIWKEKADRVAKFSKAMDDYITQLKADLLKEAGLHKDENGKDVFNESDLEAATRLFGNGPGGGNKGPELEGKLKAYKDDMLGIDPEMKTLYEKTFPVDVAPPVGEDGKTKEFTEAYFHMTPTVAALTILSKFQNNVKNAENLLATYCHTQVGAVKFILNKFEPIAVGSSTYLMPNDELTISAGVGAFNDQSKPQISFDGASAPLNDKGVAEKKFNVSGSGAHKVHVSIAYTKPDGTTDHLEKDIEYTVGTPSGASVSPTKMNVFYIGVENPVAISPGIGWDQATATFAGQGEMSGSGNDRIVKVNGGTEATINVNVKGKTTPFKFRVKTIPDPIGMVGPSKGGRIQSNIFKAQDLLRAELLNFDFQARFNVASATVYFAGAGFTDGVKTGSLGPGGNFSSIRTSLDRCKPGSTVTFDDLKVTGPDGRSRVIPPVTFVLF